MKDCTIKNLCISTMAVLMHSFVLYRKHTDSSVGDDGKTRIGGWVNVSNVRARNRDMVKFGVRIKVKD